MKRPEIISRENARTQGLSRFFTGQPCKHGHMSERYVSDARCIVCDKKARKIRRGTWTDSDLAAEEKARFFTSQKNIKLKKIAVSDTLSEYEKLVAKRARLHINRYRYYDRDYAKTDISYTECLLGYTRQDFIAQIGYKWGNNTHHLDHKVPIKVLIKNGITSPRVINHLSNLTFITKKRNLSKGSKLEPKDKDLLTRLKWLQNTEDVMISQRCPIFKSLPYWEQVCIDLEKNSKCLILYNGEPRRLVNKPNFGTLNEPHTYEEWQSICVQVASSLDFKHDKNLLSFVRYFVRFDPKTEEEQKNIRINNDIIELLDIVNKQETDFRRAAAVIRFLDLYIHEIRNLEPTKSNIKNTYLL
ncbi:hypothetical protein [Vibrio parahaemolyticus]|uniref:hypothetical protein n=1 Tax=Vibrio parahaemolyticus TaxID=670 RepID=UPI00034D38F2|nr:hypothetical protein [Vibrio parahaemolyticus]